MGSPSPPGSPRLQGAAGDRRAQAGGEHPRPGPGRARGVGEHVPPPETAQELERRQRLLRRPGGGSQPVKSSLDRRHPCPAVPQPARDPWPGHARRPAAGRERPPRAPRGPGRPHPAPPGRSAGPPRSGAGRAPPAILRKRPPRPGRAGCRPARPGNARAAPPRPRPPKDPPAPPAPARPSARTTARRWGTNGGPRSEWRLSRGEPRPVRPHPPAPSPEGEGETRKTTLLALSFRRGVGVRSIGHKRHGSGKPQAQSASPL